MGSKNYYSKLRKYLVEAAEIKGSYETAKSRFVEEYEIKKQILANLQEKLKNYEEAHLASEEDGRNYQIIKNEYELLEKNMKDLSDKIEKINDYMLAHLETIKGKLKQIKEQFVDESTIYKYQLLKAKYDFLAKAIEIRKSYLKMTEDDDDIQELRGELEFLDDIDYPEAFKDLSSAILKGEEGAITEKELYKALFSGRIPSELKKDLRNAEEKTYSMSTD